MLVWVGSCRNNHWTTDRKQRRPSAWAWPRRFRRNLLAVGQSAVHNASASTHLTRRSIPQGVRGALVTDANVNIGGSAVSATSVSLLARARQNDREAWQRLVYLYSPLIYSWCRRYGLQEADAHDVGQDVLRSVFQNLDCFRRDRPGDSFRSWLKTMTRNRVIDFVRRAGRTPGAQSGVDFIEMPADSPDDDDPIELSSERKVILRRAMEIVRSEIEPKTWDAFWQATIDEKPAADVAQALGVSTNVVYLSKSRVLRRLSDMCADLVEGISK
jgi:RNA polymerase sigma-70 factor, ECF subfamily